MKMGSLSWTGLCLSGVAILAGATSSAEAVVTFDWAVVGDAGNAPDGSGRGAVGYDFAISKHEVTNAQYVQFLNAVDPDGDNSKGLYSTNMTTSNWVSGIDFNPSATAQNKYTVQAGRENLPVAYVSWNSSARFVNWLHNGQNAGSTETGVYDMSDPSGGRLVNNSYALPTLNEWVKAAHYDPNKSGGAGYWLFATRSDDAIVSDDPTSSLEFPDRSANFYSDDATANGFNDGYAATGSNAFNPGAVHLTEVDAYSQSASAYGTLDQAGNLVEWLETSYGSDRGIRGGSWNGVVDQAILWRYETSIAPTFSNHDIGFRVVMVPEPSTVALALCGGLMLLARCRPHASSLVKQR